VLEAVAELEGVGPPLMGSLAVNTRTTFPGLSTVALMSALPVGTPSSSATVERMAKPISASRPDGNSSPELMPPKVRGTVTDTGGRLEGVGEGMLALVVAVALAEPEALLVAAREERAVRECESVARTDTLMVAVAGSEARAEAEGDSEACAEGESAEGVARSLPHALADADADADTERDWRPLALPLAEALAERESHDAVALREEAPLAEKEGDAEAEPLGAPLRDSEALWEGEGEGD